MRSSKGKSVEERFWEKVGLPTASGCREWLAFKGRKGYGSFRVGKKGTKAHRFMWELTNGSIPRGMLICHKCDNTSCVEISHLFLGTNKDNMRDMRLKGRSAKGDKNGRRTKPESIVRGERNGRAKLTETEVLQLRGMYKTGKYSQEQLGKQFNIGERSISDIVRYVVWKHVGG